MQSMQQLSKVMKFTSLIDINISNNKIGNVGVTAFAAALMPIGMDRNENC